jgi:hypothetical protein
LEAAAAASHLVSSPNTVMFGKFFFMQSLKASVRSRPLIEARSPCSITTLPLPWSLVPRSWQDLSPYARLSARTIMDTLPLSGLVSTDTTGILRCCRVCSVGTTAAVSCGAITTPLTFWLMRVCTLEASVATSFCEFVVLSSTPSSPANWGCT